MKKETLQRAKTVLTRDYSHARLLISSAESVSSPVITGMPKGSGRPGSQEDLLIDAADAKRLLSDVNKALSLLTDDERDVLQCMFIDGLNGDETAQKLGIGYTTVYSRRKRGLDDFCYAFRSGELLKDKVTA